MHVYSQKDLKSVSSIILRDKSSIIFNGSSGWKKNSSTTIRQR